VLALLVSHCWALGDAAQAHGLLEEMAARGISPGQHVEGELLAAICQAAGAPLPEAHSIG
jgi:hypothetical protein